MSSQEQNSHQAFNQTQANGTKKNKKLQPPPDIKKPKKTE
jgi:hypothetical protein